MLLVKQELLAVLAVELEKLSPGAGQKAAFDAVGIPVSGTMDDLLGKVDIVLDSSNFIEGSKSGGMFGAGSAASPLDVNRAVQSATAAAMRSVQVIHKTASTEAA